jgi:hypothetical protein
VLLEAQPASAATNARDKEIGTTAPHNLEDFLFMRSSKMEKTFLRRPSAQINRALTFNQLTCCKLDFDFVENRCAPARVSESNKESISLGRLSRRT